MRVLIASGDGGHLTRAIAVAEEMAGRGHDVHFAVNADSDQAVERLRVAGFPEDIVHGLTRPRRLGDPPSKAAKGAIKNLLEASSLIGRLKPDLVVSTGAGVAIGPMLAGKFKRLPVAHYEPTDVVSISGKVAKYCADLVGTWDEDMKEYYGERAVNVGMILPKAFEEADPKEAVERYGLEEPVLLWITGSAGYAPALKGLEECVKKGLLEEWTVVANTGKAMDPEDFRRRIEKGCAKAVVDRFFHDVPALMKASTVVAALGGATPVEAAALGKPVLVLPRRDVLRDHQYVTAKKMEERGVAFAAESAENPEDVVETVERVVNTDPEELEEMGKRGREIYGGGGKAREMFVDLCEGLVGR